MNGLDQKMASKLITKFFSFVNTRRNCPLIIMTVGNNPLPSLITAMEATPPPLKYTTTRTLLSSYSLYFPRGNMRVGWGHHWGGGYRSYDTSGDGLEAVGSLDIGRDHDAPEVGGERGRVWDPAGATYDRGCGGVSSCPPPRNVDEAGGPSPVGGLLVAPKPSLSIARTRNLRTNESGVLGSGS